MAKGLIPTKTPQGLAELSTRARGLSQRHRTVLLLVDGRRDEVQLRAIAAQAGVPDTCFDELLALGLIALPGERSAAEPLDLDLSVSSGAADGPPSTHGDDSVLPSALSLHPESVLGDSALGGLGDSSAWQRLEAADDAGLAGAIEAARDILLRAVRAEAPVAGSLTLLKLKRARTRDELLALLDEVESRIYKPHRSLAATHTILRARRALAS